MTFKRAQKVLKDYNEWRRHHGEPTPPPHTGLEIGAALDTAILALWKMEKIQNIIFFGEEIL